MKKTILFTIILLIAFAPVIALAATNPCTVEAVRGSQDKTSALPRCINQIYVWSLGAGGLLALLMTVMGGYYYMTAAGNAEQSGKGVEMIWGAVIGLTLLFGAYLLLRTINPDLVSLKFGNGTCIKDNQTVVGPKNESECGKAGGTWSSFTAPAVSPPAPRK